MELTDDVETLTSRCATENGGLLERLLRWTRKDEHRFLLLYLSVCVGDMGVYGDLVVTRWL